MTSCLLDIFFYCYKKGILETNSFGAQDGKTVFITYTGPEGPEQTVHSPRRNQIRAFIARLTESSDTAEKTDEQERPYLGCTNEQADLGLRSLIIA